MLPRPRAKTPRSFVSVETLYSQSPQDLKLLFDLLPSLIFEDVRDDMLSSSIFTSSRLPSSPCNKRLHVGTFTIHDTEDTSDGFRFVPTTHDTYICIMGLEAMNRIVLTYGSANVMIKDTSMTGVRFDEPFSRLNEDMLGESAMKKLRALGCSLFLAAGHLRGFKEFSDFFTSLRKACAWIKNDGQPLLTPPRVPLAEMQYNKQRVSVDHSDIEGDDDLQDDDEFIKVQEDEGPTAPSSSISRSILGSVSQTRLKSPGVDVFGGRRDSSQAELKRQKNGSTIQTSLMYRIAPLQPRHKQTDKGLRDLRNENIALKYENSTLLSAKRKLEIRAALAESQTQELESLKNDMEGLRENLKMETEAKRLEANARLSESTKRKEAEAELDRLIQQQIDLAASYKRND